MRKYKLSEVGKIVSGATPKTSEPKYYGGEIPWLTPADLSGYDRKYISHGSRNITQMGYDSCSTQIMPAGTVLFSSRAPIGYVAIAQNPICTNQGFKSIVPNKNVNSEFLYYQLKYLRSQIQDMGSGTTFKEISAKKLGDVQVVLPGLDEQERIVTRIEELFSELDNAVETLEKAKRQLAVYRQAVLKDTFSNICEMRTIRQMSSIVTSGSRGWAQYYSTQGAKFIRIGNLTRNRIHIDMNDVQYVSLPDGAEGKRTKLQPNDVLVSITADLGSIGLVPIDIGEAYVNQHIAMIRFNHPNQGKLMAWYLRSEYGQKDLLKNRRGGGKLGLGLDDVRSTMVPDVSDQQAEEIIEQIEAQLSVCDSIERTVDTALLHSCAMRHGILMQIFGERL